MKRPCDQAKLLFFAFLRSTVSAIATSESKIGPTALSYSSAVGHLAGGGGAAAAAQSQQPQITLRLARRADVASIQKVNLATLPENYNQVFYANHMRQWPELALVAECIDPAAAVNKNKGLYNGPSSIFPSLLSSHHHHHAQPEPNIVAYVLGKVEERPVCNILDDEEAFRENPFGAATGSNTRYVTERLGHVTSLAVSPDFRRQGLARDLMVQLHHHLQSVYACDSVGLHVRKSNSGAAGLYEGFGYEPLEDIPDYYQDGEDAYFMKKVLPPLRVVVENQQMNRSGRNQNHQHHHQHQTGIFSSLRRSKPWDTAGPEHLRLPRMVGRGAADTTTTIDTDDAAADEESSPELLTGTM